MKCKSKTSIAGAALILMAATGCQQGPAPSEQPIVEQSDEVVEPAASGASTAEAEPIEPDDATVGTDATDATSANALLAANGPQEADIEATKAELARELGRRRRSDVSVLDVAYLNTPEFKRHFAESFLSVSDIEPKVTADEAEDLQEIIELMQEGKNDRAMVRLERQYNETSTALYPFLIGQLHFGADPPRFEQAIASYAQAVDSINGFGRFQRAWNNKALCHYQIGQNAEAAAAFAKAVSLGKVDETTYGLMGVCLLNGERFIAAEMAFRQALMLNPDRVEWKQGLARCLFKEQRYPEASALFASLIDTDPDDAKWWLYQGNALLGMGETRRAAENFQIADQLGGSTNGSLNLLADIYSNDGLTDLAVNAYLAALAKDEDASPDRALRSARGMTRAGNTAESARLLDGLQAHYGDSLSPEKTTEILKLRAKIAVRNGDGEGEIDILQKIVDENPLDGDAVILLGEALGRASRTEEAILKFEVAAGIEGFEAEAKRKHGQLLVRQTRYAEAVPLLKASLELEDKASVRDFLAIVEKAAKRSGS